VNYSEKEIPKISHVEKIAQLKESQHDLLFLNDLQTVNDDFSHVDKIFGQEIYLIDIV
jgi:hypothetical protein